MIWMLEHPGWDSATPVRAMRTPTGTWLITTAPIYEAMRIDGAGAEPHLDVYNFDIQTPSVPPGLARALQSLRCVRRLRNADLWDAIATAIIRQVIRAGQARKMHRVFRQTAGQRLDRTALIPTPEQVLAMTPQEFASLGMAFKRRPLQAAAAAYLANHAEWAELPPDALVKALQEVPRIGPWTAGAAVADHTGNFSFYPYADLAVRTWAALADPATAWSADEPAFAAAWRHMAGSHLSTLTVFTLAWGDHHGHQSTHSDQGSPHH